jgi:hypothetical protein
MKSRTHSITARPRSQKRHYARWERKSYTPTIRIGVGFKVDDQPGELVPIASKQRRFSAEFSARVDKEKTEASNLQNHSARALQDSNLWPLAAERE